MDHIRFHRMVDADWTAKNPVLNDGEPGYDKDNRILKIGDGVTPWSLLIPVGSGSSSLVDIDGGTS